MSKNWRKKGSGVAFNWVKFLNEWEIHAIRRDKSSESPSFSAIWRNGEKRVKYKRP